MTAVLPERTAADPAFGPGTPVPAAPPAEDLLARLARVPGDRVAVVAGDTSLTFGGLRAAAAAFAARLTAAGAGPEALVALHLSRGAELVVALIGTLTAGAAYLPVDPKLPAERRRYLVSDSAATLVVSDGEPPTADVPVLAPPALAPPALDVAAPAVVAATAYRPAPVPAGGLAYVIYTSGSTGVPKGVEISRAAAAALLAELESAGIAATDGGRVGWNASPSFDASVQQWVRICRGDTLVMIDDETRGDPALLAALVDDQRLTDLDITPSHADALLELVSERGGPRPLTLLIGGEAISPSLWERVARRSAAGVVRAVNLYGPTECTVDATAGWITAGEAPHIGSVLPGLRMRLLDEKLSEVAEGGEGELYLAGARVGRGYRGRPTLTAERFVADPVAGDGGRMYRTGDRCRLLPGGRLAYLGRADGQVKLRGHRVELPEIEAALTVGGRVTEAVVVLREDVNGAPGLVAYLRSAEELDLAALREELAVRLPAYMVPSAFVPVTAFPTTPNGKVDRAALPAPAAAAVPADEAAAPGDDAPQGRVEELIAGVWATVLGAPHIGREDNFFKLGGHSLLAIKLVSRVRTELGVSVPVRAIYSNPRLRDLAAHIESLA
ncbi:non-ribosomal peptide synthetase [Streptomyces lonarensis]|uniref:Non-ribosomal peptide synthetase n=1 Tax=Streptomyces lonarensis TaxID=700599 RepID=A0A7X6I178_9ACTN|nr:non-ribosomal peptide synthetase [Streptomyces lonarensis]NJQ08476.1 non-ribosomal peptide synthetase [Streptomyces lonarensis]